MVHLASTQTDAPALREDQGRALLAAAREAIAGSFAPGATPPPPDERAWTRAPGAAFVTLTIDGVLRGCIGSLEARRPLLDDVRANAVAAAHRDPRFPPLRPDELPAVRLSLAVLSPLTPVACADEDAAVRALRPGVDGVVLRRGAARATLLPAMWDQLPDPRDFLRTLKRKAGLPAEHWDGSITLERYTVAHWEEPAAVPRVAP